MSDAKQEVGRFFRHSSIYAIGNALNRVGAFLLLPIYTRLLTPTEYGALETLYLISSVASGILGVGIAHATLRFYFDYEAEQDRHAVVSTNLLASMAISTVGVALIALFAPWLSAQMLQGLDTGHAFQWMLVTIIFELASQVSLAYVRATERSVMFIAVSFGKLLVQVAANTIALMHFHAGVEGVMIGNALTVIFGFLLLTWITLRDCGTRFEIDKLRPVLNYSLPFLWTTIVGLVSSTADRFLLQRLVSLEALGIYALAIKFAKLISDLIGEPVNRAYGAFRFTIMTRSDAGVIQGHVVRYLAVFLTVIGLLVLLFTGDLLRLIAAPAYWSAARYLTWLVPASILSVLVYPLQTGIYYQKQTRQIVHVALMQCCVGAGLGFALIWAWGIVGACLTVLVVALATVIMTNHISQRFFRVEYETGKLAALVGLAALAGVLGAAAGLLPPWWAFLAKLLIAAGFVAALPLTRVIEPAEVAQGRALLRDKLTGLRTART